jgi:imidazole glycerol phosphate synthase, glutamine amidotransferase subunit
MLITVIDYGLSNILSVCRAIENLGHISTLADEATALKNAQVIILPGVGAFGDGMAKLKERNMLFALKSCAANGTPILGICLGMQLLFDASWEFGLHKGLGLLSGEVKRIPAKDVNGIPQQVPHVSWQQLLPPQNATDSFFAPFSRKREEVYFVHSYEAIPQNDTHILAECEYGGRRICAAAGNENVFGTQFHPEKSGPVGLAIMGAFLERTVNG